MKSNQMFGPQEFQFVTANVRNVHSERRTQRLFSEAHSVLVRQSSAPAIRFDPIN
jgi:hypothetical protein